MSNTFEFAEQFGYNPPFSFTEERKGYYTGITNFKKLFEFIKDGVKNNGETLPFDYKNFVSNSKLTATSREQQAMFPTRDAVFYRDKHLPVNIPYETESSTGEKLYIEPLRKLNKKIGAVHAVPDFRVSFDFKKEEVYFDLAYKYIDNNEYAIIIKCQFFSHFETILKLSGYKVSDISNDIEETLIKYYKWGFNKAGQDPNELDWIYEKAPNFVIVSQGAKKLIKDLSLIVGVFVDEIGVNEEKVVLKIMNALAIIHLQEGKASNFLGNGADKLLETLITKKIKTTFGSETLFERLYSKMNDKGFGEENFTKLMLFIYNIWYFSSWSSEKKHEGSEENSGPQNLAYTNKKILGFYQNGFDFDFVDKKENSLKIRVTRQEHQGGSFKDGGGSIVTKLIGEYHPFEPLRLPEIPEKGEFKINKTVIPAFYLKAFDDKAAWSNFETGAWLALDIVTTFTGVGNILKFRHLTKLAKLAKVTKGVVNAGKVAKSAKAVAIVKLAAGVVEFTSGMVNVLITLSQTDSKFAIALQKYLFYLEMITLTGEVRVALKGGLKKYAREAIAQSDEAIRKAHPEVFKHLEEVSGNFKIDNFIERGIKNGRAIGKINKKTIIRELRATQSGKNVAQALKDNRIILVRLDEVDFKVKVKEISKANQKIDNVTAAQNENYIYLKNGSPLDRAFGEIVHEGQHAFDELDGLFDDSYRLRKETKLIVHDKVSMKNYVDKMTDDQVIELRARIAERKFQIEAKQKLDFNSVSAMVSEIFELY